ncbi:MAG: nicotinate-nucleotide--dimethylbenzimidazole phosphoribosyltransferase [Planctomycetota bacterium]
MSQLDDTIAAIRPVSDQHDAAIQAQLDDLTKPRGSLGRLEELARWFCRIRGTDRPGMPRARICTFAGDHGVAQRSVSAFPQAVTAQMVRNMLAGGAAVNVLAAESGAGVEVIDVGVADPLEGAPEQLVRRKVRPGTADLSRGPAMTTDQAHSALAVGIERAQQAAADGIDLLGTGEMGIANTTAASALFAALLGLEAGAICGRGTGIDDVTLAHKIVVVEQALARHRCDADTDPLKVLARLGGLEIAAIAGLVLGAAAQRIPVLVDGFISCAGALVAWRLAPSARDYCMFSHRSAENGHAAACAATGARPLLDLDLRLGEGTGAALAMHLVSAAIAAYTRMATFSAAGVSDRDR